MITPFKFHIYVFILGSFHRSRFLEGQLIFGDISVTEYPNEIKIKSSHKEELVGRNLFLPEGTDLCIWGKSVTLPPVLWVKKVH